MDASKVAVTSVLPPGTRLGETHAVDSGSTYYIDITAVLPDGSQYDVTFYRRFASSELDGAGLHRAVLPTGTQWVGTDRKDFRSVYFLSNSGAGVHVSESSSPATIESIQQLRSQAQELTASPADAQSRS